MIVCCILFIDLALGVGWDAAGLSMVCRSVASAARFSPSSPYKTSNINNVICGKHVFSVISRV